MTSSREAGVEAAGSTIVVGTIRVDALSAVAGYTVVS